MDGAEAGGAAEAAGPEAAEAAGGAPQAQAPRRDDCRVERDSWASPGEGPTGSYTHALPAPAHPSQSGQKRDREGASENNIARMTVAAYLREVKAKSSAAGVGGGAVAQGAPAAAADMGT